MNVFNRLMFWRPLHRRRYKELLEWLGESLDSKDFTFPKDAKRFVGEIDGVSVKERRIEDAVAGVLIVSDLDAWNGE